MQSTRMEVAVATRAKKRRTTRVTPRRKYIEDRIDDIEEYLALNYEWALEMRRWAKWVTRTIDREDSEEVPPVPKWPRPKGSGRPPR